VPFEKEYVHKNGSRVPTLIGAALLERSPLTWACFVMDITERRQAEQDAELSAARRSQLGSGDRSEKVRTYNYPQDRVTDHRIGMDLSNLPGVLDGNLDRLLEALSATDQAERLASLADDGEGGS
jgi:protein subunit release factor A